MNLLSQIQTDRVHRPPRLLVYGSEGIGKSSFGAAAPDPIFIQTEDGIDEIDCHRFPLAKAWEDVVAALETLTHESHDYRTIVLDSLDRCEHLIWDRLCADFGVSCIERVDGGFSKGFTHALTYWRDLLCRLDALRNDRNLAVLLIAHSKIERFEDPEGAAYDRYAPRLHKLAAALVTEWCDAVFFATRKVRVATEDRGFNRVRGVAYPLGKEGGDRILKTTGGPTCVSKNRYGLPEEIELSWPAFMAALTNRPTFTEEQDHG